VRPDTIVGERFVVEREAGSGGMGTVFRAIDRLDGSGVALKVLRGSDAGDVERFTQEAAILAELRHPAIVRYVAHGVDDGRHYLAMEWLEGEDLACRLARRALSASDAVTLVRRAADALACAHARGMVHRDLKPSNLFLPGGDVSRLKLVDFGIARITGQSRLTCTGVLLGTPGYVAPEQLHGDRAVDPRTDVFSLGCVFFECLTGRPAFAGEHALGALAKILLQDAPSARAVCPEVPEALDALILRMLAKDPSRRPRDGAEVAAELDDALSRLASGAPALDEAAAFGEPSDGRGSRPSAPPPSWCGAAALTLNEQRIVSVVLAGDPDIGDRTLPSAGARPLHATEVAAAVEPYGGRVELQAGRALVVTLWGHGNAGDRATQAARCALALRARSADLAICVVTGRGLVSAQRVGGELIDRGVGALRGARSGTILLDEATAGALGPRFEIEGEGERLLTGERAVPEAPPLLLGRPSPCVGRERELAILTGAFDGCVAESMAGVVLVSGPPGIGKSRLCRAFLDRIGERAERSLPDGRPHVHPGHLQGCLVLTGRGDSLGADPLRAGGACEKAAGSPFGMIADAIRRAAGIRDGEPIAARRAKLAARIGRRVPPAAAPRVTAFLGELTSTPFPDEAHDALRTARENAILMGDSMQTAWEDWISAECAAHPVLLVLDDLQWGDAATVRLVDATLRNLRELPLMVLCLARPEVGARFPGLWEERELSVIRLGPLSRRASERLVRDALGEGDAALLARVVERGGGNPFYLQELVRAVAEGRDDVFPASVLDAVEARLDAEGGEAKRVLRAASVFGDRFSRDGVSALTASEPRLAGEWLERLAARELIAPASAPALPGDADYVFRHALVREAAYATLVDADRALGHLLAGEWLERTGHTEALAMAEHFQRGGSPARSVRWYRRAAEQALEASDLEAAIERADKGVASGAEPDDRGALRLIQAEAHVWRGELAPAEARALEASALLAAGSAPWFRAVTQAVLAAGKLGGFDRVEGWVDPASAASIAPGAEGARIVCLSQCASFLIFGGRIAAADQLIEAIDRALAAGDPQRSPPIAIDAEAFGLVHQMRSFRASAAGDLGTGLDETAAALAAFEQAGDRRNACAMRANLGFFFAELGDFERAEEALRAALAEADRMGLHDLATAAMHNLGHVLAYRGALDEARLIELRAVESFARQGDPRMEGVARAYLAKIALLSADLETAEREARAAAEALRAARPLRPLAVAVLARVLLAGGRSAEARPLAYEAFSELEALGAMEEGESLVRLVHAEALMSAGDGRAFASAIGVASDRLLARAARISDPGWRRRFLADVPENARTLSLASG
jgi:tetratricopeptide (TPR) repeat protein